jgi:DNA-binding NtrC family response regulator
MATILIVDDEPGVLESFRIILEDDYDLFLATTGKEALKIVMDKEVGLVLLDILMPEMDGIEVLRKIKEIDDSIPVIMITASKDIEMAVKAMKSGAYDYITKPFDLHYLKTIVRRVFERDVLSKENIYLREDRVKKYGDMIWRSERMRLIFEDIKKVADMDSTVLITGESGTGKELIAHAIHRMGKRRQGPFITVNCPAIPENLIESELFGHEKGAFTSAISRRIGKFEFANGGTIFLDEISTLSPEMQAKLLRVLQEKKITRVGSNKVIPIDTRIISATNINLEEAIEEGKFRRDLYYRLNVVPISVPPLRERREDITLLAHHFLRRYESRVGRKIKGFSKEALQILTQYDWPGNVRELENLIEMLVILIEGDEIDSYHIPLNIRINAQGAEQGEKIPLRLAVAQFERDFIQRALKAAKGNRNEAAKILCIHRNTLFLKMRALGLS